MEELNKRLKEFFEDLKEYGEPVVFSQEDRDEWIKKYSKFNETESKIEKIIRRERLRVAAKPDVFLTF